MGGFLAFLTPILAQLKSHYMLFLPPLRGLKGKRWCSCFLVNILLVHKVASHSFTLSSTDAFSIISVAYLGFCALNWNM